VYILIKEYNNAHLHILISWMQQSNKTWIKICCFVIEKNIIMCSGHSTYVGSNPIKEI